VAAAFSIVEGAEERIVVAVEISTALGFNPESVAKQIRRKIAEELEVETYRVVFVRPGAIPRTTSGKVRRSECARMYSAGLLRPVDIATRVRAALTTT
jgi:acyl-CoA synthetase (AMP-forming)/AMP-acid ligase II